MSTLLGVGCESTCLVGAQPRLGRMGSVCFHTSHTAHPIVVDRPTFDILDNFSYLHPTIAERVGFEPT